MSEQEDQLKSAGARGLDAVLGLEVISATMDGVVATLEIVEKHHQPFGIVHGGLYCAIGESVASMSAFVWLTETGIGGGAVGVNNNTDFLRAVSSGTVTARSTPVHRGKRQQLWLVEMSTEESGVVARSQVRLQNVELPNQ